MPPAAGGPIAPQVIGKPGSSAAYVLAADDQILVNVLDLPEIDGKTYRIDSNGFIKLPITTGRIRAAGLTVERLEDEIAGVLKTILKEPHVTITVAAFRSQSASVMGAVRVPGIVALEGRKTLVDVLSASGGLTDDAGYTLRVVRRMEYGRVPLPSAKDDATILERAFEMTAAALRDGELVCIFPEGRLTRDGEIASFRAGLTRIVTETPVPVIPMAITGLWGSLFSRRTPKIWQRLPRKLWHRVVVTVGEPVAPQNAEPEALRERVCALYGAPIPASA